MASRVTTEFARASAAGEVDLNADTFYTRLVMSNTTVDTENSGITTVAGYTTLDEHGTAGQQTLANIAVNKDDANNRAEFDADDVVYAALAAGARDVVGVLVCKQAGGAPATSDLPCFFLEYATAKTPDGSNFTIQWNAEGIAQLTVPA